MKNYFYIFFILSSLFNLELIYSQAPTYNLTAKNFEVGCINYLGDALYFDVYLEWTNSGTAPNFELSGTQLFFSFNKNVLKGTWPPGGSSANPDTTQYSYKIIGSDLAINMIPRNPSLWTASSPTADIMRGNINTFPGAGNGTNIPAGFPGTKIARFRLWNKLGAFRQEQLNIAWRNPPIVAFSTKVFAYVGTTNTDITTSATHSIDFNNNPLPGITVCPPIPPFPITLYNPPNNAINSFFTQTFIWNKNDSIATYSLIIALDSNFTSIFYNDSSIIDSFKTVTGFYSNTSYYWKVIGKDILSVNHYSNVWKFTTAPGISLNLKFLQEGLYSSIFNLLYRKDTVKVYLRDTSPPYTIIDSSVNRIDSVNFTANYSFQNPQTGTYYIVTKHINSLETWSKSGGQFLKIDSTVNYDFTSSASQAYGNNLKLRGSKYCAYAGDVDQNGYIDGDDMSIIDNDAYLYLSGSYLPSDLNGDGTVDGLDFLIGDNNWQYITVKSPLSTDNRNFKFRVTKYYEP